MGTRPVAARCHLGSASSTGERANRTLVRMDSGALPNQITATLPATGHYLVVVGEQPIIARGARFRGAYCLGLQPSAGAQDTFVPYAGAE